MSTAGWFTLSVFALVLGLVALRLNAQNMETAGRAPRSGGRGQSRDRRRWAASMEWEFLDNDPVLPSRWRYGTIHQGGPGVARNLVTGSVLTDEGRRLVYVFDHEQAGRVTTAVAAVQRRGSMSGALELRMPSAPLPDDAGLDLLEPVGQRYAFVSDAALIRPMITPRLVRAADAIGEEVELLWAEDAWVLATAPLNTPPDQLQDLLDHLVEVAAALDVSAKGGAPAKGGVPAKRGVPVKNGAPARGAPAETITNAVVERPPAERGLSSSEPARRDPDRREPDRRESDGRESDRRPTDRDKS